MELQSPKHVPIYVEAVLDSKNCDTYSLHVADCHEYFAGGALVQNCYDMVRYALMSRPVLTDQLPMRHEVGSVAWGKQETDAMEEKAMDFFTKQEEADKGWGEYE